MSDFKAVVPLPTDAGYAEEWGTAWSRDPQHLTKFYSPDAEYTDAAMQVTVTGRDGVAGYYHHMSKFIGESNIVFDDSIHASQGCLTAEWTWAGTVTGPLRLRDGLLLDLTGQQLSTRGVAVCRYDIDGLLTRHVDYWDLATMLAPAGVRLTTDAQSRRE